MKKLGEGHALYGFQGKRGACVLCDIQGGYHKFPSEGEVPYDVWERQGVLEITDGDVIHYGCIERFIEEPGKRFHIKEIAFDRWGAVQMVQNLEELWFTVVPFGLSTEKIDGAVAAIMALDRAVVRGACMMRGRF